MSVARAIPLDEIEDAPARAKAARRTREVTRAKAQVAEAAVRGRSIEERDPMIKWLMGTIVTMLIGLVGAFLMLQGNINAVQANFSATATRQDTRLDSLDSKIDRVAEDLRAEIRALRTEVKGDITTLRTEVKGDINALRAEIRATNERMDTKLDALMAEIRDQRRDSEARVKPSL